MPDELFAHPRLAAIYDQMDADRSDLEHYVAIVDEFDARSVLDIGCGTGCLATLLAAEGIEVVGLDPAIASLEVARGKQHGEHVRWILGEATAAPRLDADMAVMTGNVAQVFVTDDDWDETLRAAHSSLRATGLLVFETRRPSALAWRNWTRAQTFRYVDTSEGRVESWVEVTDVTLPLVSFTSTYRFDDGATLTSESTLRFRSRAEIDASLARAGFDVLDVREAPDRPGLEWVYVARAT